MNIEIHDQFLAWKQQTEITVVALVTGEHAVMEDKQGKWINIVWRDDVALKSLKLLINTRAVTLIKGMGERVV